MIKKFIIFILILNSIILLGCGERVSLMYKNNAKDEIDEYFLLYQNPVEGNWYLNEVIVFIEYSKTLITKAKSKKEVDEIVHTTQNWISGIYKFTLIDEEIRLKLAILTIKWLEKDSDLENVLNYRVSFYFGMFNEFYVFHYSGPWSFGLVKRFDVKGYTFDVHGSREIYVLNNELGGTLTEMVENGSISDCDLDMIYKVYKMFY